MHICFEFINYYDFFTKLLEKMRHMLINSYPLNQEKTKYSVKNDLKYGTLAKVAYIRDRVILFM